MFSNLAYVISSTNFPILCNIASPGCRDQNSNMKKKLKAKCLNMFRINYLSVQRNSDNKLMYLTVHVYIFYKWTF